MGTQCRRGSLGSPEGSTPVFSPGPSVIFPTCTSLHAHVPAAYIFFMMLTFLPSGHSKSLLFIRRCNESICPAVPPSSIPSLCTSVLWICSKQHRPLRDCRHWERLVFYVSTHFSHSLWRSSLSLFMWVNRETQYSCAFGDNFEGQSYWQASWSEWRMVTGMNFMDQIKCLFDNTLSSEFHCGSWMWRIREIVKMGDPREGGLGFYSAGPMLHSQSWKSHSLNSKGSSCHRELKWQIWDPLGVGRRQ